MEDVRAALPLLGIDVDPLNHPQENLSKSVDWLYRGISTIALGATGFANVCAQTS